MIIRSLTAHDADAQITIEVFRHPEGSFLIVRPLKKVAYPATEHEEQAITVGYLRARGVLVFAVPNEGERSKAVASKHKREGMLTGASDLIWVLQGQTVYNEMKKASGSLSDISAEQRSFLAKAGALDHLAVCTFGFKAARYVHERLPFFTSYCKQVQHGDVG
jgi:hypothetical protein